MNIQRKIILYAGCLLSLLMLQSCFTGVEGTKKITLTKKELSSVAPTKEELYLENVEIEPVGKWKEGRRFKVTDDRLNVVMLSDDAENTLKSGDVIEYAGIEDRLSPDGNDRSTLVFRKDTALYRLAVDKTYKETIDHYTSSDLPMLIDLTLIEEINGRLAGQTYWTRTPLWYTDDMKYKSGRKYVPVKVTAVEPGDTFFPVKIQFKDDKGDTSYLLMNVGNSGNDTRGFAKLFMLTDPRKQYRNISDATWEAIQRGEIIAGMTKEECRLSVGNPSDTNVGHDYSRQLEIWNYPDGSYIHFVDDVVVRYRK